MIRLTEEQIKQHLQMFSNLIKDRAAIEQINNVAHILQESASRSDFDELDENILFLAIDTQSEQIINTVLQLPINKHPRNSKGQCPLTAIVLTRNLALFNAFEKICPGNCLDKEGKSALYYAIETGQDREQNSMAGVFDLLAANPARGNK